MTDLASLETRVRDAKLAIVGVVQTTQDDICGPGSIVLLGPAKSGFWAAFKGSDEFLDGRPDPMDRWSRRVLSGMANGFGATVYLPSDGPPYPPFIAWALRSGAVWPSPVGLLISAEDGLWVSFRGALHVAHALPQPAPRSLPCSACRDQPCLSACPVGALSATRPYDVAACHAHLDTPEGTDCMEFGCRARRFCPVSAAAQRDSDQSAFHMKAFHP